MPSFREALAASDRRIALYPELKGQVYVLECGACGEATSVAGSGAALPDHCYVCGLDWSQNAPKFWVLVPKSQPEPGEE